MAETNSTILGKFRLSGTNDFQQRIPDPSQAGLAATAKALLDPMNGDIWNAFYSWLINRVGAMYTRTQVWRNGLEQYVKQLEYGTTVEEVQPGWVRAHTYMDPDDSLLRSHYVEGGTAFHSINYTPYYPITVNEVALRRAVTTEYGLNELIASIMTAPDNSDQYDVYKTMLQLFRTYDDEHPIYTVNYSAAPSSAEDYQNLLTDMVAWGQTLQFPSATYNATGDGDLAPIPVFANPEDLTLFVTPQVYAGIGVKGLAMLFNDEYAKVPFRVTVVDEFPMTGVFAILTTDDFFQCYRTLKTTTSFYNPRKLETNFYLHDQMVISASPFAPVVAFGTRAATTNETVTQAVTGVTIAGEANAEQNDSATQVSIGGVKQLTVSLTGTISPETPGVEVSPDAVTWTVSAMTAASDGEPIALNSRTYVDDDNVLHVQRSGLEANNVINVTGTTTYANPSGTTTPYTKTLALTVKDMG